MSSYIPKQWKPTKERLEVKLDRQVVERLEKYCQYLDSDREYIVSQALEIAFKKDKGFALWLTAQDTALSGDQKPKEDCAETGKGKRA
jgi:predicted transcriptional regulator